jgi:hypothetical protein
MQKTILHINAVKYRYRYNIKDYLIIPTAYLYFLI